MKTILINTLRLALVTLIAAATTVIVSGCASESKSYDSNYGYSQPTQDSGYRSYPAASSDPKSF